MGDREGCKTFVDRLPNVVRLRPSLLDTHLFMPEEDRITILFMMPELKLAPVFSLLGRNGCVVQTQRYLIELLKLLPLVISCPDMEGSGGTSSVDGWCWGPY